MRTSNDIGELAAALAKAQGEIEGAHKDSANPFFKSKYADLASVWEACRVPLSKNGLAIVQLPRADGNAVTMETRLVHSSGQWIEGELTAVAKDEGPQSIGSTVTYLRRYMLQSVTGVAPEDDDGNAATDPGKAPQRQTRPPQKQQADKIAAEHGMKTADELPKSTTYDTGIELIGRANNFELLDTCYAWLSKQWAKKDPSTKKPALLTAEQYDELTDRLCNRAIENVHFPPDVPKAKDFIDRLKDDGRITDAEQMTYWTSLAGVEESLAAGAAA